MTVKIKGQFLRIDKISIPHAFPYKSSLFTELHQEEYDSFKIEYIRENGDVVSQTMSTYGMNEDAKKCSIELEKWRLHPAETKDQEDFNLIKYHIEEAYPMRIRWPEMYVAYYRGEKDFSRFFTIPNKLSEEDSKRIKKSATDAIPKHQAVKNGLIKCLRVYA